MLDRLVGFVQSCQCVSEQDVRGRAVGSRLQGQLGSCPRRLEFTRGQKQQARFYLRVGVRQIKVTGARILVIRVRRVAFQLVNFGQLVVRVGPLRPHLHGALVFDERAVVLMLRQVGVATGDILLCLHLRVARTRAGRH